LLCNSSAEFRKHNGKAVVSKRRDFIKQILATILFLTLVFFVTSANDPDFLQLVNKHHPLSSSYIPPNLCNYDSIQLNTAARDAFTEMLVQMKEDGIHDLKLQSAYRSYSYQNSVFARRTKEIMAKGHSKHEAEAMAAKSVQPPGASEHQLGLALDVSTDGTLTQNFGQTRAGIWLAENCHNYGFIIRYPFAKTDITQIVYEPWHLRYVGIPHSIIMKELSLTLEEYHSYIRNIYAYVYWMPDGEYYLISYVNENIITERKIQLVENFDQLKTFIPYKGSIFFTFSSLHISNFCI